MVLTWIVLTWMYVIFRLLILRWNEFKELSGCCVKNTSSRSLRTCDVLISSGSPLSPDCGRVQRGQVPEQENNNNKKALDWHTSQEPLWRLNKSLVISFGQMWEHSNLKGFESRAQLLHFVPISKENTVSKAHLLHRSWSHSLGGSCDQPVLHGHPQFGGQKVCRTASANLCCRSEIVSLKAFEIADTAGDHFLFQTNITTWSGSSDTLKFHFLQKFIQSNILEKRS